MGLGGFLEDMVAEIPGSIASDSNDFITQDLLGGKEADEAAAQKIKSARDAADLFKGFAATLRDDAAPLRGLRDRSLIDLVDVIKTGGDYKRSPEFKSVLNAATSIIPEDATEGLITKLQNRAHSIAKGQFRPFAQRAGIQAGVGARGLNSTNALLQQNIDARSGILDEAGKSAAEGLLAHNQQSTQTATGIGGLLAGLISDERLKKNIEKIGELDNGLNIYQWEWKDSKHNQVPNYGVIAQEVQKTNPDAVTEGEDGLLRVDLFKATGVSEEQLHG